MNTRRPDEGPTTPPSQDAGATGPASPGQDDIPQVAPSLRLSRRGLIFSLLAMVIAGVSVYRIFPESVGGPALPVEVEIAMRPVETMGGEGAVLTEVMIVTNLSGEDIPRLSLAVNDQYLLFREPPLKRDEELVLPLRVFTDKRSSQRYDPKKYPPTEVVVTGQLPSGARGLTHFDLDSE